jgi:serine/threonine protein kinase
LKDDHLVKIIKAYKLGDFYNFIFPCAKTNLGLYLRESHFRPFQNSRSIVDHPIWTQFLGLARGLHRVLDFEEPNASHSSARFGYHSDLKPANILVEEETESLVITDFGQATFKEVVGTTSSKVVGLGGTEAYAPPEIDSRGGVLLNRRYDIWSLGCVLVEICTFVVRGNQGVLRLDRTRVSRIPGTNSIDDRFFRRKFASSSYELKPEIKLWIQELPQFALDIRSKSFLNDVLLLALQMLHVEVESRLISKEVCIRFSRILDRFGPSIRESSETTRGSAEPVLFSALEVGRDIIERLQSISYNVAGFWKSGPVRFTLDNMILHVNTLEEHHWVPTSLGNASQLRLVPRHALRDTGPHYFSDASLYLLPGEHAQQATRTSGKFAANNLRDDLILQEFFLGQMVSKSLMVKSAHLEQKQRKFLPKKFPRRRSSESSQQSLQLEHQASSVQIWTEKTNGNLLDKPTAAPTSRRQSPRSLRLSPPPRRIVIFYERSIAIVRIGKNVRIQHPNPTGSSLFLVPTDEKMDPSFRVSVFRAKEEERSPSLPLSRAALEFEEEQNSSEFSSLTLDFGSIADSTSFYHSYKRVKKAWVEEVKAFEELKNQVGPEFGYARS